MNKSNPEIKTPEQLQTILEHFWLLSVEEYSIIKDYLQEGIDDQDKRILEYETGKYKLDKTETQDDVDRYISESKLLRNVLINMKEKIDYIITNGLYKKHKIP